MDGWALALTKLLHIAVGMWFVAGLVGRTYATAAARRSKDLTVVNELCQLAGTFDRVLVVPGSMAVLVLGLLTGWLGGYPLLGFLQGAPTNWLLASLLLYAVFVAQAFIVFPSTGKEFDAAMSRADALGTITPELTGALNDQRVAWAHRNEIVIVAAIVVLMVLKPF